MTTKRPHYRERQPLQATDLNAEQTYRIQMRRRHNIAHHGWGIVEGLQLIAEGDALIVEPGMAVDGFGRELIVPERVAVPMLICDPQISIFDALESEIVDVWLVYGRDPETPPQRGRWKCGPDRHQRWREEARVRLTEADIIDFRKPVDVPASDLDFGPHQTPPDDPAREWPVFLGRITRADPKLDTYDIDCAHRPYIRISGEMVTATSGRAQLQVGSEKAGDHRRFAILVANEAKTYKDHLNIDCEGNTTVNGNTSLKNDLIVGSTVPETDQAPGAEFLPLEPTPAEALPWQIYRTVVSGGEGVRPINQLRFEIGHPGDEGDPTLHKFVVGWQSPGKTNVKDCLTVDAGCNVTVKDELEVEGQLIESPIPADLDDPRFPIEVATRWIRGLEAAIDAVYVTMELSLDVVDTTYPKQDLPYKIKIHNTGPAAISDITVEERLTLDGDLVQEGTLIQKLTLSPGRFKVIENTYVPEGIGELNIVIDAKGFGPGGNPAHDSATETVIIINEPPV